MKGTSWKVTINLENEEDYQTDKFNNPSAIKFAQPYILQSIFHSIFHINQRTSHKNLHPQLYVLYDALLEKCSIQNQSRFFHSAFHRALPSVWWSISVIYMAKKARIEGWPYNAIRYTIYNINSIDKQEKMVKAFILVLRNQKKTKVFVKDIKELCVTAKRKVPSLPKYIDGLRREYEQRKELSCSQNNGL